MSRWLVRLLVLTIILSLLAAAAFLNLGLIFGAIESYSAEDLESTVQSAVFFSEFSSYLVLAAIVIAWLLFFVWVYRTSANAHVMGADLDYSAGLSVGAFFIPFLNLFLPPLMMSGLAKSSVQVLNWRDQKTPLLVPCWWLAHILSGAFGIFLGFTLPSEQASFSEFQSHFFMYFVSFGLGCIPYMLLALLIRNISANQRLQVAQGGVITSS